MRVLVPVSSAELGGGQLWLLGLIDRLPRDEFSFSAWLFRDGPLDGELEKRSVPVTLWPRSTARTPWGLWTLAAALRRESPDLVYLHASRMIAWLARRAGIPCVERINMSRTAAAGGWCRFESVDRFFTVMNTKVVAVSQAIADQLTSRGVPPEKVAVIRNFVDPERFHRPDLRDEVRRELGLAADAVVVLNIGRLAPQKSQADFVETAARCAKADERLHFLLAGDGPLKGKIESQAGRLGLGDRFRMLGFTKETGRLYAASDILLHSARWEPLANVLLEAMAAGLAVVATDVDGTREAIPSPDVGQLVAPGDVSAMAEAVLRLAREDGERERMGRSARKHVLAEFSPDKVVRQYEELFRALASGGPG